MNTKQFTILIVTILSVSLIIVFVIANKKTPEQITAETNKTIELQKLKQIELEERHRRQIEIQASKPVEVQVAEKEISVGEAVIGATIIGGSAYVMSKLLR